MFFSLKASRILLSGDHAERNELMEAEGSASDDRLCDKYLDQSANVLASECIQGINLCKSFLFASIFF